MKIMVLCKRLYMGKDLIDDRYGRLFELPVGLASLGHEVLVAATAYRARDTADHAFSGVHWTSCNLLPRPDKLFARMRSLARQFLPDIVISSSDAPHVVFGSRLADELGVCSVVDLYDDYEAFGLTRWLGLRTAFRAACSSSRVVVAISSTLGELVTSRSERARGCVIIGNGVPAGFAPALGQREARRCLRLPLDAPLVGTGGALISQRGIGDLLDAFDIVKREVPNARLVLAGPRDRVTSKIIPADAIDLGLLPHGEVAVLFRALDVGVVCNRPGLFAEACHPMKLVEMAACGLPVVAADIGEVTRLLSDRPDALSSGRRRRVGESHRLHVAPSKTS